MKKAFISYSWDSDEHKEWVAKLAADLQKDGVHVTLDQWHLVPGDQLPAFMESAVRESDYVLIICTPKYKERSDKRSGGVGSEGDIMTGELLTQGNHRKFIPILRQRPWLQSAPSWLAGKVYVDLSDNPYSVVNYRDLITTLLGNKQPLHPESGSTFDRQALTPVDNSVHTQESEPNFEPITILGIIVDEVGTPLGDGTRGSALYNVPFRLSSVPPYEWEELFVNAWNHPSRNTTMHRPGILSVIGNKVYLDGTTIDEIQQYHRDTLILATNEANSKYQELIRIQKLEHEKEEQRIEQHKNKLNDTAKNIKFTE